MSYRILVGNGETDSRGAILYESVTGEAFGPVFSSGEQAQRFLDWVAEEKGDPGDYWPGYIRAYYSDWLDAKGAEEEEREALGQMLADAASAMTSALGLPEHRERLIESIRALVRAEVRRAIHEERRR